MHIQWFPGHMHKAGKEIKAILPDIDLVIEILDARLPYSSENPALKALRGNKPCIKVLNKNDLADPDVTLLWQQYFEREHNVKTLPVSLYQPEKIKQIIQLSQKLAPNKAISGRRIQALVTGIPNAGKSSVINVLAGRVIAKTGNEPAITKRQQRIDLGNNFTLLDTPGLLWANIRNHNSGFRLAITGAIKDTAFYHDEVALFAARYILSQYPGLLNSRYNFKQIPTNADEVLSFLGTNRGCLRSGGLVDMDKAAKILLSDIRTGKLGRISFETPDMVTTELNELALLQNSEPINNPSSTIFSG